MRGVPPTFVYRGRRYTGGGEWAVKILSISKGARHKKTTPEEWLHGFARGLGDRRTAAGALGTLAGDVVRVEDELAIQERRVDFLTADRTDVLHGHPPAVVWK